MNERDYIYTTPEPLSRSFAIYPSVNQQILAALKVLILLQLSHGEGGSLPETFVQRMEQLIKEQGG